MELMKIGNNETLLRIEEPRVPGRYFLPALVVSRFAIAPPSILTAYLLLEIGSTFGTPVGVTGQIRTVASIIGAITAVLMGVWSVRYNHKALLLLGLGLLCFSAVGCALAINFFMMLFAFSLYGLAMAIVLPMIFALVGEHLHLEQRAHAIGWVFTGGSLAFIISAPVIGLIADLGGWRWAFLGLMLPAPLFGFILAIKVIPYAARHSSASGSLKQHLEGFREIFTRRSAVACLLISALSSAAYIALELYGTSFLRERFFVSLRFTSVYFLGGASSFVVGSQVGGRIVNRFGRKPIAIVTAIIAGSCIIAFMNMPNLLLFFTLAFLSCMFLGIMRIAMGSLTLEQIPDFRGTMMSLYSAASFMGGAIGAGVGGLVLLWWNYTRVGLVLGSMSLVIALLVYFIVMDPTNTVSHSVPDVNTALTPEIEDDVGENT